jgi:hypothetical protein
LRRGLVRRLYWADIVCDRGDVDKIVMLPR